MSVKLKDKKNVLNKRPLQLACIMLVLLFSVDVLRAAQDPGGFNGALWGQSPEQVKSATGIAGWQTDHSIRILAGPFQETQRCKQAQVWKGRNYDIGDLCTK